MNYQLKHFSDAQLIEELARRHNDAHHKKIDKWCHSCKNFVGWIQSGKAGNMPDSYNPCIKNHKMGFLAPLMDDDPHSSDNGFYRIVCVDRDEASGVSE